VFYALSKTLDLLVSPLFWGLFLLALAAWRTRRRDLTLAYRLGVLALLTLYVPASGLAANRVFRYAEHFEAPRMRDGKMYDGVVLLGGFAYAGPGNLTELSEGADRLLRTWELLRQGRARSVVVAAGGTSKVVEADRVRDILVEAGIEPARILLGRKSLNTRENAVEARDIVRREHLTSLVLVTSAFHMQRAYECFRAVGLTPDVLATDHQAPVVASAFQALAPRAMHLALTELALRELTGRSVYRMRGYAKP